MLTYDMANAILLAGKAVKMTFAVCIRAAKDGGSIVLLSLMAPQLLLSKEALAGALLARDVGLIVTLPLV